MLHVRTCRCTLDTLCHMDSHKNNAFFLLVRISFVYSIIICHNPHLKGIAQYNKIQQHNTHTIILLRGVGVGGGTLYLYICILLLSLSLSLRCQFLSLPWQLLTPPPKRTEGARRCHLHLWKMQRKKGETNSLFFCYLLLFIRSPQWWWFPGDGISSNWLSFPLLSSSRLLLFRRHLWPRFVVVGERVSAGKRGERVHSTVVVGFCGVFCTLFTAAQTRVKWPWK